MLTVLLDTLYIGWIWWKILTFDEINKTYFWLYFGSWVTDHFFSGPRIPKWNSAHLAWSKQAKNIGKTSKNSWVTAPCFSTRQTGHPVEVWSQGIQRYLEHCVDQWSFTFTRLYDTLYQRGRGHEAANIKMLRSQWGFNGHRKNIFVKKYLYFPQFSSFKKSGCCCQDGN